MKPRPRCPDCGGMTRPHCLGGRCDWVFCRDCGGRGQVTGKRRWIHAGPFELRHAANPIVTEDD